MSALTTRRIQLTIVTPYFSSSPIYGVSEARQASEFNEGRGSYLDKPQRISEDTQDEQENTLLDEAEVPKR